MYSIYIFESKYQDSEQSRGRETVRGNHMCHNFVTLCDLVYPSMDLAIPYLSFVESLIPHIIKFPSTSYRLRLIFPDTQIACLIYPSSFCIISSLCLPDHPPY